MENGRNEKIAGMVLGINDGLIELTGVLVGLSFALPDPKIVALTGLITGVAASLSMAASAYMHARQEQGIDARTTAVYTGLSYLFVVILLVSPFFIFSQVAKSVVLMMFVALVIIFAVSGYSARFHGRSFRREFGLMLVFSLGVAAVTFVFGQILKRLLGIEIEV